MYREPSPAAPKCALKNDPSAHARSSIRRRGAVRQVYPRAAGSSGGGPPRPSLPRATFHEDARHNDQAQAQLQNQSPDDVALLDAARNGPLVSDYARRDAGSRLLRDALRHGQPGRRLRIPRESSLRFEIPSPPWSMNDFLSRASSGDDANAPQNSDGLPFTPRFAPAFAFRRESSGQGQSQSDAYQYLRPDGPVEERMRETRARPPRPRSRREEVDQQRSAIDGLGDRLRSTSPDDERDDAWETLLTTITPDASLPSTDSSFTSAAALSANPTRAPGSPRSAPSQPASQGPSATVHMILEPYPEFLNPCDFPDYTTGSDTEPEADFDLRASESRNRHRRRSLLFGVGSTQDSQPPIPRLSRTSTLPSISSLLSDPSSDVDMNTILDRLLHREDVPDEWWAAAGLSRTIGRRLELGNDSSNRTNDTSARGADET